MKLAFPWINKNQCDEIKNAEILTIQSVKEDLLFGFVGWSIIVNVFDFFNNEYDSTRLNDHLVIYSVYFEALL